MDTLREIATLAPDIEPDELRAYTFAQVGERLGVSESTVRRMVRAGQLRPVLIWGKARILPAELRRYLDHLDRPMPTQRRRRHA